MMTDAHARKVPEVEEELSSDSSDGLSEKEAKKRLDKYGQNVIELEEGRSIWAIIIEQFVSPIVWILVGAGILAFLFDEILEGIAIGIVILINAVIGFFMEYQAIRSMEHLKQMGRGRAKVVRDGKRHVIDSACIVPGDLIFLESGDVVSADARVVEQHSLGMKEASLTGESAQIDKHTNALDKDTPLADRTNCVFRGTVVTRGNAHALVYATGKDTEIGNITELAHGAKKDKTPLDKRLQSLSKRLIWLTLGVSVVMLLVGVARGKEWLLMIETAIALAVAAIPEGLPVIATMTLARGMLRLARKNVIIKQLEAVQTLGEADTILTDKTGTLTENEMYLDVIKTADTEFNQEEEEKLKDGKAYTEGVQLILKVGVLCNNSTYNVDEDAGTGDPIEVALLRSGRSYLEDIDNYQEKHPRKEEIPFDSEIKKMVTVNETDDGFLVCVKGATESLLEVSNRIFIDGKEEEVSKDRRNEWLSHVDDFAAQGYRVLAFAYKKTKDIPSEDEFTKDLVFLGIAGFIDPAREDVSAAIEECKTAGIKVIMVTGDHPETAGNIAEKVGIVENGRETKKITSKELEDNKEYNGENPLLKSAIFARINPEQKLDLVKLFQKDKRVVGMTGDGVNDAPALKKADIGIAMGQRGTDAAMEAADVVLRDDAFSSIVLAIRQGRIIFENIRNFVVYLLSCNLSEIMVVAVASFAGMPLPLMPLQILYLNMITDVFPALALGMNEGEANIMQKPPRNPDEPLIPRALWKSIVLYGLMMTIGVIGIELTGIYYWELENGKVNNLTFYTLILTQLWNVINLPEASVPFWRNQITRNRYIWMAIVLCLILVYVAWLIDPVRNALDLVDMEPQYFLWIIAFSLIPTLLIQVGKRWLKIFR